MEVIEALRNWWGKRSFYSRAKQDYLRVAVIKLRLAEQFPGEEELLLKRLENGPGEGLE